MLFRHVFYEVCIRALSHSLKRVYFLYKNGIAIDHYTAIFPQ